MIYLRLETIRVRVGFQVELQPISGEESYWLELWVELGHQELLVTYVGGSGTGLGLDMGSKRFLYFCW